MDGVAIGEGVEELGVAVHQREADAVLVEYRAVVHPARVLP